MRTYGIKLKIKSLKFNVKIEFTRYLCYSKS